MTKGYWIAHVTISDEDRYRDYVTASMKPLDHYGGRFVARGGNYECVEGEERPRSVIVEFDSYDQAKACYHSPDYQHACDIRKDSAKMDVIIIEGYDGAQPGEM